MKNELIKKGVNIGNYFEDQTFNLNQEIQKLRMQIKEKDKYINNITAILLPDKIGSDINDLNEQINSGTLSNIMNRISELEKENKRLKNGSEDAKISESLAKENAKLRMKIAQLESRLSG
jgi:predicted  nucleic acid-binding Zn-ribbon protein